MTLKRWIITGVSCAVIFIGLASIKALQIRSAIAFAESFPEQSESVESAYGQLLSYAPTIIVSGRVLSPQQLAIHSESSGRIAQIGFASGDTVKKGQLLLQLDASEEIALLDSAQTQLALAQSILKRNDNLFKSNAVSEENLDRAKADVATAKANIAQLNAIIRKKTISAAFTGTTGMHQFEVGQLLQENMLITQLIGKTEELWVDFQIPQTYSTLEKNSEISIQAFNDTNKKNTWINAEIISKSNIINPSNLSMRYRASIISKSLAVPINTSVNVRIAIGKKSQAIKISATAVQQDYLGQYIYVLDNDEHSDSYRAKRQSVDIISKDNSWALLRNNKEIDSNTLIATDGAFKLHTGLLVHSNSPTSLQADEDQH